MRNLNSDLKVYTALFVYDLVIGYPKRREKIIRLKAFDKKKKKPGLKSNQILGTVLQYSYFCVISRFPLKAVERYRNFLAVLPPPPYTKLKLGKKFRIPASNIDCGVRGGVGPV